jgi:hypothetical protein
LGHARKGSWHDFENVLALATGRKIRLRLLQFPRHRILLEFWPAKQAAEEWIGKKIDILAVDLKVLSYD